MTRRFSAPGKLVLCGEYAILDGFPAVVAAVDRRAVCTVDDGPVLRVRGDGDAPYLPLGDDILRHLPSAPLSALAKINTAANGSYALLFAVLRALMQDAVELGTGDYDLSSTAFSTESGKLGLGSSAAVAVAMVRAFVDDTDRVHRLARAAHYAFQGGGSGVDVAASTYGGVLVFSGGNVRPPSHPLPAGVDVVVAFTGRSVKTQGYVDAYLALPKRRTHALNIADATAAFLDAKNPRAIFAAVDAAREAMAALGESAGTDVVSAEHERIAAIARAHGGAAKPSGAGGGDVAVCFVTPDDRAPFVADLVEAGFVDVKLHVGAPGARMDP